MTRNFNILIAAAITLAALAIAAVILMHKDPRSKLILLTGQPDDVYESLGKSLEQIIENSCPDIEVQRVSTNGSVANLRRVASGSKDLLALAQNDTFSTASIRILAPLQLEALHILAHRDSDIRTVGDLAGKKIVIGPNNSGTKVLSLRLLAHYGLTPGKDYETLDYGITEATEMFLDQRIDGMLVVQGLRAKACCDILSTGQARFISLGDPAVRGNEAEGFALVYPYVEPFVIPAHGYSTLDSKQGEPPEPIATLAVTTLLVCHEDFPPETAKKITRAIFDNRPALIRSHPGPSVMSEQFDPAALQYPLHAGARAYYDRDKPSFLTNNAETMGFLLSAFIAAVSMLFFLKQWFLRQNKNRIDRYYQRLNASLIRIDSPDLDMEELGEIESQLTRLSRKAFQDLIAEKLQADESFRIFQSLLADCRRHARERLQNSPFKPPPEKDTAS